MVGRKTHEQQLRTLERKPDIPDGRQMEAEIRSGGSGERHREAAATPRPTEHPVSHTGMNQEDRDHNKHNRGGQQGHKPQRHREAEEKT